MSATDGPVISTSVTAPRLLPVTVMPFDTETPSRVATTLVVFDPVLEPASLPVSSPVVLPMPA